jgi:acetyl-CoA synthase
VELLVVAEDVEDGRVRLLGRDVNEAQACEGEEAAKRLPVGLLVEVSGRAMRSDFEPILERRLHESLNRAQGLVHAGGRERVWMGLTGEAVAAGFRLEHLGRIIQARLHKEFGRLVDKVQVTIMTAAPAVEELDIRARAVREVRDERLGSLTDEAVATFYSCTICQSFAPNHVCILSPERPGLCGSYDWVDARAGYEIDPTGPNLPVPKGVEIDARRGRFAGVDAFVWNASHHNVARVSMYSLIEDPMTSCGCFEVISGVLPGCGGVMAVECDHEGMTPCGLDVAALRDIVGRGSPTPGFLGHSRRHMVTPKYIRADGGIARLVWMSARLKEQMGAELEEAVARAGYAGLMDKIATEVTAVNEEEVRRFLERVGHPALAMRPMV